MQRIYHTWEKWECYPAGFYENNPPGDLTPREAELKYRDLLTDIPAFEKALETVIDTWKNSCEHYLTNENMNRIAWLGQASLCVAFAIPACFRSGFRLLNESQQKAANESALKYLNIWLDRRGEPQLSMDQSQSKTQPNLY